MRWERETKIDNKKTQKRQKEEEKNSHIERAAQTNEA